MSWILPPDHEHDENGQCIPVWQDDVPPEYSLSGYDLLASGIMTVGNLVAAFSNAVQAFAIGVKASTDLFAQDFAAAANYARGQRHEAKNRRLLADDLRSLEEGK